MIDIEGTALSAADRDVLRHPLVGGIILFARNYESPDQVSALIGEIHALRSPRLLVAVDQEGGRVQRFRHGFVGLPPLSTLGERYDHDPDLALEYAADHAWMMASELRAVGVDFSFAPVLDLRGADSAVIGNRAIHARPEIVATLARAYVASLQSCGMAAVGKHFPGHGGVSADSHVETPVDARDLQDLEVADLMPFRALIESGIAGIMMAHVAYPAIDRRPAGYSETWIRGILRGDLRFDGLVFSDDLSMEGAAQAGSFAERARQSLAAGCDVLLICNRREAVLEIIDALAAEVFPQTQVRLMRLHARGTGESFARLQGNPRWRNVRERLERDNLAPELELGDDNLLG